MWVTFCGIAALFLEHLKKSFGNEFEHFKSCDIAGKPLQHRNRPGRDTACQGKGKFGKLEGEKSCIVVYGSARSSECEAHGPSATATI